MPSIDQFVADNSSQLARLRLLVEAPPANVDLGGGWTVSVALAHLAFWDRRAAILLERWQNAGKEPDDPDDDVLNVALLHQWGVIPLTAAASLAMEAAIAVDAAVASLDDRTASAIVLRGDDWLLHRGRHCKEHLDQIEGAAGIDRRALST